MDAAGIPEGCRDGRERLAGQCLHREYLYMNRYGRWIEKESCLSIGVQQGMRDWGRRGVSGFFFGY